MSSCSPADTRKTWSVYLARDPRNGHVLYVGVTTKPKARFSHHVNSRYSPLRALALELKSLGDSLVFQVVFSGLDEAQAKRAEMRLCFLHTQANRHRFLSSPVDVVKSKDRICAIGPKPVQLNARSVACDGCGKQSHLRWRGATYKGPWLFVSHDIHVCEKCRPTYHADPEAFMGRIPAVRHLARVEQLQDELSELLSEVSR